MLLYRSVWDDLDLLATKAKAVPPRSETSVVPAISRPIAG